VVALGRTTPGPSNLPTSLTTGAKPVLEEVVSGTGEAATASDAHGESSRRPGRRSRPQPTPNLLQPAQDPRGRKPDLRRGRPEQPREAPKEASPVAGGGLELDLGLRREKTRKDEGGEIMRRRAPMSGECEGPVPTGAGKVAGGATTGFTTVWCMV
jgi:hypothetical protein